ncbi:MAG: class D sortase [Clostridia bacterium]|nr:class D sortase [Clostridia bacterium]
MYSKRFINILAFILTTIIFLSMNFFINKREESNFETTIKASNKNIENNVISKNNMLSKEGSIIEEKVPKEINWQIEIPKISLTAPISEGTSTNILNEYVGHFEETQNIQGNIGLAAHNRGYPVNYFARIKELKEGDEIIYIFGENKKEYKVTLNIQISDIDWSYLENTEENKITLITCIENKPEYRRCVQAIEN